MSDERSSQSRMSNAYLLCQPIEVLAVGDDEGNDEVVLDAGHHADVVDELVAAHSELHPSQGDVLAVGQLY
jgi:hypothetical protein